MQDIDTPIMLKTLLHYSNEQLPGGHRTTAFVYTFRYPHSDENLWDYMLELNVDGRRYLSNVRRTVVDEALLKPLSSLKWEFVPSEYPDTKITDGEFWSFMLDFGGRKIVLKGYSRYPHKFRAVEQGMLHTMVRLMVDELLWTKDITSEFWWRKWVVTCALALPRFWSEAWHDLSRSWVLNKWLQLRYMIKSHVRNRKVGAGRTQQLELEGQ